LSDERFVEVFIRSRQSKFGSKRLAHELKERGIDPSLVSASVRSATQDERELAKALWQQKFGTLPENAKEKARQIRFLQNRGFTLETILKLLGGRW
jgi:regulatory protein